MRKTIFSLPFLLFAASLFAQTPKSTSGVVQSTVAAIENSDASAWLQVASPRIWFNFNNENKSYSKQQVEIILKDFFQQNKVSEFTHGATQTGQHTVIIGELQTVSGRKYHVVYKLKGVDTDIQLIEISLTPR